MCNPWLLEKYSADGKASCESVALRWAQPGAAPSFHSQWQCRMSFIDCHWVGVYTVVLLSLLAVIFGQKDGVTHG